MRRTGVRAAAVGLCLATFAVAGCTATHPRPAAAPTPVVGAPSSSSRPNASVKGLSASAVTDGYAGLSLRCRARIAHGRLTAPFWLQFDHFDPAGEQPLHTAAEVLHYYRTSTRLRDFRHGRVHIAFADYTNLNGRPRPTIPVWVVVGYRVTASSLGLTSRPVKIDAVSIIDDRGLRPRGTILTLPSRCD